MRPVTIIMMGDIPSGNYLFYYDEIEDQDNARYGHVLNLLLF